MTRASLACASTSLACALGLLGPGCKQSSEAPAPPEHASAEPPASSAPSVATSEPPNDLERVHRVGQTARAPDYALSVVSVKRCEKTRIAPRAGHQRLGVEVRIEGLSEREVPVNPFYARLQDQTRDGYAYAATFGGCEPALEAAHVTREQSMAGFVTFEIPENARGLELAYSPYVLGRPAQTLRFDLGR